MNLLDSDADLLRDLALALEIVDLDKAKRLMEIALLARPTGPFIKQKVEEYRKNNIELTMQPKIKPKK